MNTQQAFAAIQTLIEHACETYPHFESDRGQQDIEQARQALEHLKQIPVVWIEEDCLETVYNQAGDEIDYIEINKTCLEGGTCPVCHADTELDEHDKATCPDCGFHEDMGTLETIQLASRTHDEMNTPPTPDTYERTNIDPGEFEPEQDC